MQIGFQVQLSKPIIRNDALAALIHSDYLGSGLVETEESKNVACDSKWVRRVLRKCADGFWQ